MTGTKIAGCWLAAFFFVGGVVVVGIGSKSAARVSNFLLLQWLVEAVTRTPYIPMHDPFFLLLILALDVGFYALLFMAIIRLSLFVGTKTTKRD